MNKEIGVIDYTKPSKDRQFYLRIDDQTIYVDIETYRDYMRPIWREKKNAANRTRCMIAGEDGKAVRCTKDCKLCPLTRNNGILSLDRLYDDDHFEVADSKETPLDKKLNEEKYKPLYKAIESLTENQRRVLIQRVIEERSFVAIAREMSLDPSTVREIYQSGIKKLRKLIKFEDFL